MYVRSKVSLLLLLILAVQLGAFYGIGRLVLYPSFASLEREEAREDLERCVEAIRREVRDLGQFVEDWSAWDDAYEFVKDRNKDFVGANLVRSTFVNSNLNVLYFYNSRGEAVWGQVRAPGSFERMQLEDFPAEGLPPDHPLLRHESIKSKLQGIWRTSRGPALMATRPILTSDDQGPMRGTLVMGRFLGEDEIAAWRRQSRVSFSVLLLGKDSLPEEERAIVDELRLSPESVFRETDSETLRAYTILPAIGGEQLLLLRADVPRQITGRGKDTLFFFSLWSVAAGSITFAVLWVLLTVTVTGPLGALSGWVKATGAGANPFRAGQGKRRDEIGILVREFDQMVGRLAEAKRKLLDESYYSGMAEMAGGILHNVRNCLNPISGQLALLRNELTGAPVEKLGRAQRELSDGDPAPERREDLGRYVVLVARRVCGVIERGRERLEALSESVAEMERILGRQDRLSRRKHLPEELHIEELVREAVTMIPAELCEGVTIEVTPSVKGSGSIKGYRVPLLEVLINVLTNAHEAMRRGGTGKGQAVISAEAEEGDGRGMVHLRVRDNGVGIAADQVEKIFERGVSSKKEAASGFGLHWCANAMAGMHGRIYAESAGDGKGAVIHVLVPRHTEETV